jgi:hypothetical protein
MTCAPFGLITARSARGAGNAEETNLKSAEKWSKLINFNYIKKIKISNKKV